MSFGSVSSYEVVLPEWPAAREKRETAAGEGRRLRTLWAGGVLTEPQLLILINFTQLIIFYLVEY